MSNCQNIGEHDDIHENEIRRAWLNMTKKTLLKQSKCMKMTIDCAGKVKTLFLKWIINRTQTTFNFYSFLFPLGVWFSGVALYISITE